MQVLIDGYNVIHRSGILQDRGLEAARDALIRGLERIAGRKHRVTIVFDSRAIPLGCASREWRNGVEVRYAVEFSSADAAILATIRGSADPARVVVVTDDRELAGRAQFLGARTMPVAWLRLTVSGELFRPTLTAVGDEEMEPEKPPLPSPEEVEEWLRFFGIERSAGEQPPAAAS